MIRMLTSDFKNCKKNATIYGETYLVQNGNIECICKNGEKTNISNLGNIEKYN